MLFNICLVNHLVPSNNIGGFARIAEYIQMVLGGCGHEVIISSNDLYRDAINLVFEGFFDDNFNKSFLEFKLVNNLKIGMIATELVVGGQIPYAQSGFRGTEEATKKRASCFELMARELDFVWCFLQRTADWHSEKSKICHFFPVGYLPATAYEFLKAPRDIDLIFFGKATDFRVQVIESITSLGINVSAFGDGFQNGHLDELLLRSRMLRSKIGLSISFEKFDGERDKIDPRFASCFRIKEMLESGICIVSETLAFDNPYERFMVSCSPNQIAAEIRSLLTSGRWKDEGRRFFDGFRQEMDAVRLCRPVVESTISQLGL